MIDRKVKQLPVRVKMIPMTLFEDYAMLLPGVAEEKKTPLL
jgi:hypothetical protein